MTENEFYHYGIKGMRWGIRRYQKKDGSLTPAGKKRYDSDKSDSESNDGKFHLTSNQKKAIAIGAGVAAAVTKVLQKKGFGDSIASNVITEEVVKVGRQVINGIFR